MRYHIKKPDHYDCKYGSTYIIDHPIYSTCTLYLCHGKGLGIIQQRFDPDTKHTYWTELDPWLVDEIYENPKFADYFGKYAGPCEKGFYPTIPVRKVMWALRMKPLKRHQWETTFDRMFA